MITFTAHISRGAARLVAAAVLASCAVATSLSRPAGASARAKTFSPYGWPVKPFHRQHPIRGANGVTVNPVQAGHLTPYADRTKPEVDAITFRATDTGRDLMPGFLRGSIEIIAESYDTAPMPVPGRWKNMPVAPAMITWHLETLGGRPVTAERVAVDFRRTIPKNNLFWSYYARGTYQNQSVFKPHYSYGQPGCFLFKLTRGLFDTHSVKDGVYDLVVTATDIRGNHGSAHRRVTIHNRPGWLGS